ncbi:MAG: hypothetical protein K1X50_13870 [Candidatus Promineofilum sp.]|nr:hypothetical protein [Promineifilum sp.]
MPLFLVALALLVAACSPTGGAQEPAATSAPATTTASEPTAAPAATEAPGAAEAPMTTAECPTATDDTYLLRNPQHGYCLLYPTTHKVERPNADEVDLVVGSLLNAGDPRANIRAMTGEGLTAESFADDLVAGFEGFEIARSETTVAGQPAVVLDDVPGQDINRQVIFTLDGRLYHIYFAPVDPANTTPIDDFMAVILDSFTPMPVSETLLPEDECLAAKSEQTAVRSEAFGFCALVPADFTYEEVSATNVNLYVGSMMDVAYPKLMIEVTEAGGQTAAAAADALVASMPDMDIQRTFGYTLGYEPAEMLDGVPGQDLGRLLLVVRNDRLYKLTFVPADPTQAEVYAQMEELFNMVVQTWRFLP